jgi:polyhydroxyalkanoate synthase
VLSNGGHIAAVINPPGNPKAVYRVGDDEAPDHESWLAGVEPRQGTWWEDWDGWLAARAGPLRPAARRLGSRRFKPVGEAPGTYVLA